MSGGWRYQPVIVVEGEQKLTSVSLCECYFDDDHRLKGWTESAFIYPTGDDAHELQSDICKMLLDAFCWKPAPLVDLKVGMTFERSVTMAQREALAKMVTGMAHNLGQAANRAAIEEPK